MSHGIKMKYFVLKPAGDTAYSKASRMAMHTYADSIEKENPVLADDLRNWAQNETVKVCLKTPKKEECSLAYSGPNGAECDGTGNRCPAGYFQQYTPETCPEMNKAL